MHITIQKTPVVISLALLAVIVVFLAGVLAGRSLEAAPVSHPADVPADVLAIAQQAGAEIFLATSPDQLTSELYAGNFIAGYARIYESIIKPAGSYKPKWVGIPVVTWYGKDFMDVALPAEVGKNIKVIELRMTQTETGWVVESLISIQPRETLP